MLRDGRSSGVAPRVFEEMTFVLEGLDLDAPPTFLLLTEELFELPTRNPGDKLTCFRGCAKNCDHGSLPRPHQGFTIEKGTGNPNFGRVVQSSRSHHGVYMGVKFY